jgi:hypothetical protein
VLAEKQQVTAEQGWHSDQEKTRIGFNLFFFSEGLPAETV